MTALKKITFNFLVLTLLTCLLSIFVGCIAQLMGFAIGGSWPFEWGRLLSFMAGCLVLGVLVKFVIEALED